MLVAWRDFIVDADPDVIIGYNIANFDFPYLLDRAKALNVESEFARLGRFIGMFVINLPLATPHAMVANHAIVRRQDTNEGDTFLIQSLWPA